ncbi:hypothetical protein [Bacillus xiapuensis]|uniref:hypothetical protein n=1 Tax=Bacillus xiapuensis TaxID=2014075 RepID=UPI000C242A2B|nr:hypothetical protein [Bacillus xiapuensis]
MGVRLDVPKQEEMTVESAGQQPVVVLKQGNACGAKGHSHIAEDNEGRSTIRKLLGVTGYINN